MAENVENGGGRHGNRWRIAVWAGGAALILLLHWVAMQFTGEVAWSLADFALAGAVLFGTGIMYELIARKAGNIGYRAAVGLALAAAFTLVWLSLSVGIIGRDGDPANVVYFGVLAVGIVGAIIARLRPHGMMRALFATALAQALVTVIALLAGLGYPWSGPLELLILNGFFIALFVGSALLFRKAAREQPLAGAGPDVRA